MELFITIHRDLGQSKVWEPPKLFFDSSVSRQTVQQLTEIVKRHQVREREREGGREGVRAWVSVLHRVQWSTW